jgi:Spy/CpxP family protein refolding chaperone
MDLFYQKKITTRIIVFLFLLNLGLIGLLVWKKVKQHEPYLYPKKEAFKDVSGILKKELQLNDAQVLAFERIRTDYYQKEIVVKQHIKDSKDAMNEEMFNSATDDSKIQRLACSISEDEYKMELIRYQQAKELKAVCTNEQLEKFEKLVKEIRDYFRPDNQPIRK